MSYTTLEEAWEAFAVDALDPFAPPIEHYNAMQVAFYMGACGLYLAISDARKSENPMQRMQHLFDEMDFYMRSVAERTVGLTNPPGHS